MRAFDALHPGCLYTVISLVAAHSLPCVSAVSPNWEQHTGYRAHPLKVPSAERAGFISVDPKHSGISFTNFLSPELLDKDSSLVSGSGLALGDIDGDGRCDIYFCSLAGSNVLYRNLGDFRFEDITESAGVACHGQISRGAVFADLNGDGALDLLVTSRGGGTRCFLNDGKGHFRDATVSSGLATNTGSLSLALADIDGNGTLDLFVANFGVGSVLRDGGTLATRMVNGQIVVAGRHGKRIKYINGKFVEFGEPSELYLNDGQAHFTAASWENDAFLDETGKRADKPWDYSLAVQMRDLNGDGWPDIYVCNDFFTPDRIWLNDTHGRFRAIDPMAIRKIPFASMGVDFADIDRDGHMDGLVVEMLARDASTRLKEQTPDEPQSPVIGLGEARPQTGRNVLLHNRGDGTYADIAEFAGVAATDWTWMPLFVDVDLDGFEDLLIANGQSYDLQHLDSIQRGHMRDPRASRAGAATFPKVATPNYAFRNLGNRTFRECGEQWGFNSLDASTSMALADLDGDGGLDVVVNCLNSGALVYRNVTKAARIAVRLKGHPPNTQGIGALITIRGGAVPFQSQEILSGGRFLAGDDAMRVFAAGTLTNRLTIEVLWRSGRRSRVEEAMPNWLYEIDETGAVEQSPALSVSTNSPLFEEVSGSLGHTHHEEVFDDLELQPSLPRRLSQLGPGVAWYDFQNRGREDLLIGSGRQGSLALLRWDGTGHFKSVACEGCSSLPDDSAGFAAGAVSGKALLLLGVTGYQQPNAAACDILQLSKASDAAISVVPGLALTNLGPSSVGPIATGDLDGDGELEVFIGGRLIPKRYPEAAASYILRQQGGTLTIDAALSSAVAQVGLVSGAVFSDLDGDGRPELILACEWGPLRVFHYDNGRLEEITARLGLSSYTGLWQSVTTGDVDGDGRMDIIAGNWGLNSSYHCDQEHPLVLYYGDFNNDGGVQVIETCYDASETRLLPRCRRHNLARAMPFILEQAPDNDSFSSMDVQQLLGPRFQKAKRLEAKTLASAVFLNRNGKFERVPLPDEAQWAPVFGICVSDFDGDGSEDLFLAQNFFGMPAEGQRLDAGRGLLLLGDGHGGLRALSGTRSGIRLYGEQRGCACADYDGDGRVDLAVSQNGATTALFHNLGAKPGIRCHLRGPAGNPDGIGAVLRISNGERLGPARELHGGSGYWSQDGLIQVLPSTSAEPKISIRWPGGKEVSYALPAQAREVELTWKGTITRLP